VDVNKDELVGDGDHCLLNFCSGAKRTVRAHKFLDGFWEFTISDILSSIENIPISMWWTLNHSLVMALQLQLLLLEAEDLLSWT
jgi:hypothetical protein